MDPTTPLSRDATTPHAAIGEHRFAEGDVLAGRYRIIRIAGAGGMGVVYEADDLELGERVALKTLHAGAAADERDVARLRREVQLARKVTHPNVCRIYDAGRHENVVFVTMELLEGDTLTAYISARGRLAPADAEPILRQLCAGLQAAHDAGIIHRDFKSGNVMLVRRGSDVRAVITDFGLARTAGPAIDALASHAGRIVGTPAYMAPEQIEGAELTPAVDVYALGVVAFEMITGEMPFRDTSISGLVRRLREPAPTPRAFMPDIDPRWEAVIVRCLERLPDGRFATPADVARALGGEVPVASPRRRNAWIWAAAITSIAIVALSAYVTGKRQRRAEQTAAVAAKPARNAVAILGFRNLSPGQEGAAWLSTALAEMLSTELAAAESLRIIPGEEIARAKRDLELANVESHAAPTLQKIRGAIGADFVVVGSYVALPDRNLRLDVRVQRTTSGDTAAVFGTAGTESDLFTLVSRAGEELRSRLGADARLARGLDLRRAVPVNTAAARHFAEGLARLRAFDAIFARDALEQAVAADPQFALAYGELSDTYALLGYDDKAATAARRGLELSSSLPRAQRLRLEAAYHQRSRRLKDAIDLYRTLVTEYPDEPDYRVRLVDVLIDNSRGKEALAEIEAMKKLHGVYDTDPRVDLLEAWSAEIVSDYKRMLASSDRAIAKARATNNRDVLGEALVMRAEALASSSKGAEALVNFEEASDHFTATGNRAGVAKSLRKRSFLFWRQGDLREARRLNERALAIYREIGQELGAASAVGGIGVILNSQGDNIGARAHFTQALEIYRRIGDRQNTAWALSSIAGTYVMQNEMDEGIRRYEEALALAREVGDIDQAANILANIGITATMKGDLVGGERYLLQALEAYRKIGDVSTIAELEGQLGAIAFRRGDLVAARRRFELSTKMRRELGERGGIATNQHNLAGIELEEDNPTDALALATAAATEFEAQERHADRVRSLIVIARANADLGRQNEARNALKTARQLLPQVQDPEIDAKIVLEEARLEGDLAALEKLAARTARENMVETNFDARYALAEAQLRAGRRDAAKVTIDKLVADANAKGYGLAARLARSLWSGGL